MSEQPGQRVFANGEIVSGINGEETINKSLKQYKVYTIVLTGGPCGGKTTSQATISTFFESLGWRVFRVPEAATVLLGGGVKFGDLSPKQAFKFQNNLLKTMMQLEQTFFDLAALQDQNCLVICDRGTMDPSAYMSAPEWQKLVKEIGVDMVTLRDQRYDQIIHMESAANGAEAFYTGVNNKTRSEGMEVAREYDSRTQQVWVGHPYVDVIDNSTDFDMKVQRAIMAVCDKMGIDVSDRLSSDSRKIKFLVELLPDEKLFPPFQDFEVVHDYLGATSEAGTQARLRRRGQNGIFTYTHTVRRPKIDGQVVELRTTLARRDYEILLAQRDNTHHTVFKTRRCFLWKKQYYQLDIYREPCHERCKGLLLLETYTTKVSGELKLPDFLAIVKELTGDPAYSMYNLSLKD